MAAPALLSACSKTHAALPRRVCPGAVGGLLAWVVAQLPADGLLCHKPGRVRPSAAQGEPWLLRQVLRGLLLALTWLAGSCTGLAVQAQVPGLPPRPAAATTATAPVVPDPVCPGPVLRFEPLAPGLWQVPGFSGEATGANRGQVSNLTLAWEPAPTGTDGPGQLWVLGSGPSPAFGRALACQARQQLGAAITEVISPWARPELVLGAGGVAQAGAAQGQAVRHWALDGVADAMAEQCPHCVDRLRQRLETAADDLGDDPISLPNRRLTGEHGALGPWLWWRLPRAEGRWITVWRARSQPLWVAPGLLDSPGPADGRDADLAMLWRATQRLVTLAAADGEQARFVGEQGGVMDSGAPARHAAYWAALLSSAAAAMQRGDDEAAPAPALPGIAAAWTQHPWHSFNWQRAWRQVEAQWLAQPADSPVVLDQRATFQRNLR